MRAKTAVILFGVVIMHSITARAHDEQSSCEAPAAKSPAIESARADLKRKPKSTSVHMSLADKLIDIGCYDEAVRVLEEGEKLSPADQALQSRLRMARSFVGERDFVSKQPAVAAGSEAEFLRAQLRCKQFGDVQACDVALAGRPNEIAFWIAKGDALLKEKRARDAFLSFNRARLLASAAGTDVDLVARIAAAQTLLAEQSPPAIEKSKPVPATARVAEVPKLARTYSNVEPFTRSH